MKIETSAGIPMNEHLPFDDSRITELCMGRLKGLDSDHSITTVVRIENIHHHLLHEDDSYFTSCNRQEIGTIHAIRISGKGLHFDQQSEYPVEITNNTVNDYELWENLRICKAGTSVKVSGCFLMKVTCCPPEMMIMNAEFLELPEEKRQFYQWISHRIRNNRENQ